MSKISGIYEIRNIITGDRYIGSSIDIFHRFNEHRRFLKQNKHHSIILQNSYNKYGLSNYRFSVICKCDPSLRLHLEQCYLDSVKPYYNISKSSTAPMQGRFHSDATKLLFKKRIQKKGKDHHSFGTKWTEEMREHFIKIRTGEKRNQDFKDKISSINKANGNFKHIKKYVELSKKQVFDNQGNVFESLVECSEFYKVKVATICDVLKGRSRYLLDIYHIAYTKEEVLFVPVKICSTCLQSKNIQNFPKRFINGKYSDSIRADFCNKCGSPNKRK